MTGGLSLDGKAVFLTGASSGLGRHMALTMARAGARVALAARRADELAELSREIEAFDGRALPLVLDVRDADAIESAVDTAETELGPIGVLINNAGMSIPKRPEDFTVEDYDRIFDINLKGAWLLAQAVGRRMIAHGHGGKIINVSSLLSLKPISTLSLYAMTKAAMNQMTRQLALEWARYDIQVNAICPGYIETEMNSAHWQSEPGKALISRMPRRRVGTPDVLDGLMLLLTSDQSEFITGSIIPIDDGQSLM